MYNDIENIIEKYIYENDINNFITGKAKKELSYIISEYMNFKQEISIQIEYKEVQFEYNILRLNESNDIPKLLTENKMKKIKDGVLEKEMPVKIKIYYINEKYQLSNLNFNYYHSLNEEEKRIDSELLITNNVIEENNVIDLHENYFWKNNKFMSIYNKRLYPDEYEFKL